MRQVTSSFRLIKDFVTTTEEESLFKEVEPHLKRQVYEKDHWDEVNENFEMTTYKKGPQLSSKLEPSCPTQ